MTPTNGRRRIFAVIAALAVLLGCLMVARPTGASPQALAIRAVTITNVTDTGFTVNWVTDQALPGSGSLRYGTSPTSLGLQVRETVGTGQSPYIHTASLASLSPGTAYYFTVVVGGVTMPDRDSGFVYHATTGPALQGVPTPRRAGGSVLQSNASAAGGVLVTVRVLDTASLDGPSPTTSAPLSTFTDATGNWLLTLTPRTADNSAYFNFTTDGTDLLLVTVEGGALGVVYPAQSAPLKLDGSGNVLPVRVTLEAGVLPAETPVAVQATATATPTPTNTATAPSVPSASPTVSRPALTPTPTRSPYVIPTVAPVSTEVEPAGAPPPHEAPTATPTEVSLAEPPPVAATPIAAWTPSAGAPVLVRTSTVVGEPGTLPSPLGASRRSPTASPSTTPTRVPLTPLALDAGGSSGASGPLKSLALLLAGAVALIGLGLAVSVVGFVDQRRDG